MKKGIIILFFIMVILVLVNEKEKILIPDDAIRFRIIANSDEARNIINNNLDKVDSILDKYNVNYNVSFGNNYFPNKNYKGVNYPAGNYESLVITLGEGKGHNWWCVLFPPLCLLDEREDLSNAKYELYATKLINKFR